MVNNTISNFIKVMKIFFDNKTRVPKKEVRKGPSIAVCGGNPSTGKAVVGGLSIQGQPWLQSETWTKE